MIGEFVYNNSIEDNFKSITKQISISETIIQGRFHKTNLNDRPSKWVNK
jgi:hypothetical protein